MNAFAFLSNIARRLPSQPAIVHGEEVITYREFEQRALRVGGNLLALGLARGDRVAFCLANSPRILELVYSCFAAGLIIVPINVRLHPREIAYILHNSGARVFVYGPEQHAALLEHLESFPASTQRICTRGAAGAGAYEALLTPQGALAAAVEVEAADPCWLFYTSGTTGRPKGAIWTHRMIRVVVMNYLADIYNIQPGEVVIHAAPLSHGSGIVALPAIARGATNLLLATKSFEPRALFEAIQRNKASHVAFLAPTQIVKMLEDFRPGEFDLSSLRAICYGGAPVYVEHLRQAIRPFGAVFAQIYGQGESPITVTGLSAAEHARLLAAGDARIGSAGTVRTDVEARCVDENARPVPAGVAGEIVVRGDIVMPGYWNEPAASAETLRNGWLHTGDIGFFDEQGQLFLLDRGKDLNLPRGK